jgi:hypothetical protein
VFGQELIDYFNNPQVKAALHIDPTHDRPWDLCAGSDYWHYTSLEIGSQWIWEGLKG